MQCEKCGQEMETLACDGCGETIIRLGSYCYLCGHSLVSGQENKEKAGVPGSADGGDETDFSKRILCSDGACIGVVNEQGFCKVCGKPYTPER